MEKYLIEAIDITKIFPGTIANDHVSFKVRPGEVMGLVGENGAGKSTILKCLNGIYPSGTYTGKIIIDGEETHIKTPLEAMQKGIGYVPQEINILPTMNVAENIYLFDLTNGGKSKFVNHKELFERTKKHLEDSGIDLDPAANTNRLSVGQQQMLMIARALATNPKVLILDEPTTSLSSNDVASLFRVVRSLKEKGVSILFVTHKLDEIMELTDSLTVMRDGKTVGYYDRADYDQAKIIEDMIGRKLENIYPVRSSKIGEEKLRIENFSVPHPYIQDRFLAKDISFSVKAGEVLGLAGLVGAGRSETVMGLFGELPHEGGKVYIDGKEVTINNPRDAIKYGLGIVTEDRKKYGLHFSWSIKKNISLSNFKKVTSGPFITKAKEDAAAMVQYNAMRIKATSQDELVDALSGGNQQKVVIGRTMNADPTIIILDEPTKGIDVGAKYEVYEMINTLAEQGAAVVMISSELPELLGMCDRFLVLAEGQIAGELNKDEVSESKIMEFATKTFKQIGKKEA